MDLSILSDSSRHTLKTCGYKNEFEVPAAISNDDLWKYLLAHEGVGG